MARATSAPADAGSGRAGARPGAVSVAVLLLSIVLLAALARVAPAGDHFFEFSPDDDVTTWGWRASAGVVVIAMVAAGWFGSAGLARRLGIAARMFGTAVALLAAGMLAGILATDPHRDTFADIVRTGSYATVIAGAAVGVAALIMLMVQETRIINADHASRQTRT